MATRRLRRSESLKNDLISELPVEIKDRILEFLLTYEVARTAVLSKHWNYVWLRHPQLVFDDDLYLECVLDSKDDKRRAFANIIYDVLLHRTGPVNKFTLRIYYDEDDIYMPEQYDLDRWCLILSSNGVQELNLSASDSCPWRRLPVCMVSCRTIKQLKLNGFIFDFPLNISCIFPNVTSLFLDSVSFQNYEIVSTIPNLEKIGFMMCSGFDKLKISTPKLESVVVHSTEGDKGVICEWVKIYWNTIKTFCSRPDWLLNSLGGECYLEPDMFPTAMNLQTLLLDDFCLESGKHFALALQLLRKSPNLCQLEIDALSSSVWDTILSQDHKEAASRLLEDPDSFNIDQNLEMFHTVKIKSFGGTKLEMLLVKTLLSKSPELDKLILTIGKNLDPVEALETTRELLRLPRASRKAQIDFIKRDPRNTIFDQAFQDFWILWGYYPRA